jgi:hypothetical protein
MRNRTLIVGLGIGITPALAYADGTGIWLWDVTTNNGDAIVEPGESASVTLSLQMLANPGFNVVGISATIFDTLGKTNADKGEIVGWDVLNGLDNLTGDVTTTDGVSLYGTNAGQLTVFGPFTSANPIDVLTFEWSPVQMGTYSVDYQTDTETVLIWEGETKDTAQAVHYDVVEAALSFNVVPAPGAGALGLTSMLLLVARRRR